MVLSGEYFELFLHLNVQKCPLGSCLKSMLLFEMGMKYITN